MRTWIFRALIAFALCVLAGVVAWRFFGPVAVEAVRPARGPAVTAIYGSGTVEPIVMLPIAPKISGRLVKLAAGEGERISQGQILAELDNRELAASVAEWEAQVRYGEAQFKRANELYKNRVGSEASLDQARNALETAKASLDRAKRQLAEMLLTAPADGIVIRRDGEIGQLIQVGEAVFWMSCCDELRIAAEIDEEDVPALKPGQRALIRADAFPNRTFEGSVSEITPKGDSVARSFRVRIKLPPNTPLMIGMTADCNIIVDERQDALLLPSAAVTGDKVWLIRDGRLLSRAVVVGVVGEGTVEIRSGVETGDLVVAQPNSRLQDGRRVRVRHIGS